MDADPHSAPVSRRAWEEDARARERGRDGGTVARNFRTCRCQRGQSRDAQGVRGWVSQPGRVGNFRGRRQNAAVEPLPADSAGATHPLREDGSMPAAGGAEIAPEDAAVVDVTDWAVIRDEPGGRDPNKRWLAVDPEAPRHEHHAS